MANERWNSPFNKTIAYTLFIKHFTELNDIYWAHVPAASTIESKAKQALCPTSADPKTFFLIHDEDDRRLAPSFEIWKSHYRDFSNYTRLNMLMLLSSCFETYLRTIVSLAIESKPGCIIGCPDAVDGVFLLQSRPNYGNLGSDEYEFSDVITSICKGDWYSRSSNYAHYFTAFPISELDLKQLDELRHKRNLVGHYFGRGKQQYHAPLSFASKPVERLSHEKLLSYFRLIFRTVKTIDQHLHRNFIGSYDVCKFYYQCLQNGDISGKTAGERAKELQKKLGAAGAFTPGNEYYRNLITYLMLDDKDELCRYGTKASIKAIRRMLSDSKITLLKDNNPIPFTIYHFRLFCKAFSMHTKPDFCRQCSSPQIEYLYSLKALDFIVSKIKESPATIISSLQAKVKIRDI